jgi:two-component system nitrogen regulation response regulator GlnG
MRRLAALCPEETITAEVIAAELADTAPPPPVAGAAGPTGPETLSKAVERHVKEFFATHNDGAGVTDVYDKILAEVERPLIRLTLAATRGNQIKAAAMLGLNRNTLRKKIRDLEIPVVRGLM